MIWKQLFVCVFGGLLSHRLHRGTSGDNIKSHSEWPWLSFCLPTCCSSLTSLFTLIFEMLCSIGWYLVTDIPFFEGQAVSLLDSGRWDWYVVLKRQLLSTKACCITSQKSEDLVYTVVEAWNHSEELTLSLRIQDVLGSNLGLETDYFEVFNGFPQSFSALSG